MSPPLIKYPVPVAVIDEHTLVDESGKPLVTIDANKLERIARNGNRRIRETGDYVPIIIGHTKDGATEHDQPEIVGYAGPFKVQKLLRTGRKAVFAVIRLFRNKLDLVKRFPRRSAELWLRRWEIDPIAFLGATAPERDLGLMHFKKSGGGLSYRRTVGGINPGEQKMPQDNDIVSKVVAAIQETAAWKYLEKLMKEHGEEEGAEGPEGHEGDEWEGEGGPAGGMAEGGGLEGRDEEGQMPPNEVEHPDGDEHSYGAFDSEFDNNNAGAEAERGEIGSDYASDDTVGAAHRAEGYTGSGVEFNHEYAAGAGAPSGSNTYTPSGTGIKRGVKKQRHEVEFYNRRTNGRQVDPVRLQRDQLRLKLARIEAQNKERDQVIRDLQVKYRRAEREKDLVHLDAQGYQFDLAEELSAVARLSGKDYKAYLDRIRKRYSRAPINAVYHRPADAPAGRGSMSQRSRQEAMAIAEYAAEHDISYSDAADKMRSGAEKVL